MGFVGDGTTNNDAAINRFATTLASSPSAKNCLEFGPGKFRLNTAKTLTIPGTGINSITIKGAGPDNTILYFPSTSGITIAGNSQAHSFHLEGFSITTGAAGSNTALTTSNASTFLGTFVAQSTVKDVTIRGDDGYGVVKYFAVGHLVANWSDITWTNFNAYADSTAIHGTGISVTAAGATNCFTGPYTCGTTYKLVAPNFSFLGIGLRIGTHTQSYSLVSPFIAQVENGVVIDSGAATLQGLNISDMDCFATVSCIRGLASFPNIQILGGYYDVEAGGFAIDILESIGTINGATFFPRTTGNPASAGAIRIQAASSTCGTSGTDSCAGPMYIGGIATTVVGTAITLGSGTSGIVLGPQAFNSNTVDISDSGSNHTSMAKGSALSLLGVAGNAAGYNASIAAGADHNIMRRNGTAIAFGAINLAQSGAVGSSILGVANGGTGLSALGTGIATWLGTPSSANLAAAVSDETGTGLLVLNDSPVFGTLIRAPKLIGGTGTTGTQLTFQTTTGNGTTDQYVFTGGNNGATTFATLNALGLGIAATPSATDIITVASSTNDARFLFTASGVGGPYFSLNASNGTLGNRYASLQIISGGGGVWQAGIRGSNDFVLFDLMGTATSFTCVSNSVLCNFPRGYVGTTAMAVGSLAACGAGLKGQRAYVTDANSTTFNATAVGGGANNVPVTCNGTNWVIGANDNFPQLRKAA
jgi:hypothetical protein